MKSLAALVGKGICVPDSVLLDSEEFEDALKATLKYINCALVCLILLLNVFSFLLCPINLVHNVFELLTSGLELALRSVTNTV